MPEFKNLKELEIYLNKKIKKAMDTKVAEDVVDLMQKHVQVDVYDTYEPKLYERTGSLQKDIEVDKSALVNGIIVKDNSYDEDTGRYIPEIIETGSGYDYTSIKGYDTTDAYNRTYEKPRPFVENTLIDLKNGRFKCALKEALKKEGIDIK